MVVGASIGEMLIPLTVANVSFKWYDPVSFLFILLGCSVAGLAIFICIFLIGRPLAQAKQAAVALNTVVVDEDAELLGVVEASHGKEAYGTFIKD
jgi:hypothetical protein